MITGILVFSENSNVTFQTPESTGLIRFGSPQTQIASLEAQQSRVIALGKGLYRVKTASPPTVTSESADVVITISKDPPSDPTIAALTDRLRPVYPDLTKESLSGFIIEPDSKSFSL